MMHYKISLVRKLGCAENYTAEIIYISRYNILKLTEHLEGKNMVRIENIATLSDTKTTTKQIPLFEEEEDGNLIPYSNID